MEKAKVTDGEKIDLILKTMSEGLRKHEQAQQAAKGRNSVQTHQEDLMKETGREEFYTFDFAYRGNGNA
jgi:hypothetical protein